MSRIAGVAVVPALVGAFIGLGGFDLLVPRDPYEEATEEAGERLLDLPGFESRFGEVDEDEAFTAGVELGMAAIPRLSDAELDEWLSISRQLIDSMDVETCAMFARGPDDVDAAFEALRAIDIETYRRYIDLIVSGAALELSDASPRSAPTQAEVDAAFGMLVTQVGIDRLEEIGTVLTNPDAASDASVCAGMRDFYDALAELDRETRSTLMQSILGADRSA